MKFYRLYPGSDGQSHFEELDKNASEYLNATHLATGYLIRTAFAPHIVNFHCAPRRRWVITVAGYVDIGVGDGTVIRFHPGDIFLAEDKTGQGHTAKPSQDWARAYINLE